MTGQAIISKLKNIEPIKGADKIVKAKIFGETVIVSKEHEEGELGVLFDIESQLSHQYCHYNNLYRHSHLNKDQTKSGYIEDNRRVKPIRLKGVQCSGFWMPYNSLEFLLDGSLSDNDVFKDLKEGYQFNEIIGTEICKKYVPQSNRPPGAPGSKKTRVSLADLVPDFREHMDTKVSSLLAIA